MYLHKHNKFLRLINVFTFIYIAVHFMNLAYNAFTKGILFTRKNI